MTSLNRPLPLRAKVLAALLVPAASLMAVGAAASPAAAASKSKHSHSINLSGVIITFGDQVKQYQTIVNSTDALKGAKYKVDFSNFLGGPPMIAAETGGSVDLGDTAETPTVFAQAAGDPVKVLSATEGYSSVIPYGVMVPPGSSVKKFSQLRGKTIAVQEGTVEQYILIKDLADAGVPYNAVTIDNLNIAAGEAALEAGRVDAYATSQPFLALVEAAGKGRELPNGRGIQSLQYFTASESAIKNPKKLAAMEDFIVRIYKAETTLKNKRNVAISAYVKTYGVSTEVATKAVDSVQQKETPITSGIVKYQQQEANTFYKLGLVSQKVNVKGVFDLSVNKAITKALGKK